MNPYQLKTITVCLFFFSKKAANITRETTTPKANFQETFSSTSFISVPATKKIDSSQLSELFSSIYDGMLEGFLDFFNYFLVQQGLSNLTSLNEQDIELIITLFVSTLNTEVDQLIGNLTNTNPFYDQKKTDNNLHDKIVHLTENLLVLISLELEVWLNETVTDDIKNQTNDASGENNFTRQSSICNCIIKVVSSLIGFVQESFGFSQNTLLNQIVSVHVADFVVTNLLNSRCVIDSKNNSSNNDAAIDAIEGLVTKYVAEKMIEIKKQVTKNPGSIIPKHIINKSRTKKAAQSNNPGLIQQSNESNPSVVMSPLVRLWLKSLSKND